MPLDGRTALWLRGQGDTRHAQVSQNHLSQVFLALEKWAYALLSHWNEKASTISEILVAPTRWQCFRKYSNVECICSSSLLPASRKCPVNYEKLCLTGTLWPWKVQIHTACLQHTRTSGSPTALILLLRILVWCTPHIQPSLALTKVYFLYSLLKHSTQTARYSIDAKW